MTRIRALIFDFDGVILDTEVADFECWAEVFRDHGCELPLDRWCDCIGTADVAFDPYRELAALCGREIDRDAIRAIRRPRYDAWVRALAPLPGVTHYLDEAARLGLKLGIASSGDRASVRGHLERLGLASRFECIRCREDVARAKPDPELYLSVVRALGLEAREAVAIEDSPNGIAAARAAGLHCVAVPNRMTERLSIDAADLRLGSLAEISLDELLARFESDNRRG